MRAWQVAVGEPHRFFEEIFFEHGVMLLGPSHNGCARTNSYAEGPGPTKGNQVHWFANELRPGDIVLARKRKDIVGVGRIPEAASYQFLDVFGCVLGWDLCHSWRVNWNRDSVLLKEIPNPFLDIKQRPAFNSVKDKSTLAYLEGVPADAFHGNLPDLPNGRAKQLSFDDVRLRLFRRGVSSSAIESTIAALRQCRQLVDWYYIDGERNQRPTENEVVSHIVLPLLLALGWSHQQVAVEWNRVDVALFLRTPTTPESCVGIIEAKGLGQSLGDVFSQAGGYLNSLKLRNVRKVVVTDGPNLFIFNRRSDSTFADQPDAYLNVGYLTEDYLLPKGTSAIDALVQLMPSQF